MQDVAHQLRSFLAIPPLRAMALATTVPCTTLPLWNLCSEKTCGPDDQLCGVRRMGIHGQVPQSEARGVPVRA